MEAAWELGAWDVARAERPGCLRPGACSTEALACLQAFGSFPFGIDGNRKTIYRFGIPAAAAGDSSA
jgi:hypothetical protein